MDSTTSLQHPRLYIIGQKDTWLGFRIFANILYGIYTSLVMFFLPYFAIYDSAGPGGIFDHQVFVYTMSNIYFFATLAEVRSQLRFMGRSREGEWYMRSNRWIRSLNTVYGRCFTWQRIYNSVEPSLWFTHLCHIRCILIGHLFTSGFQIVTSWITSVHMEQSDVAD